MFEFKCILHAGLETDFTKRCYLFKSAAECGLNDYKEGSSMWSIPIGVYNDSTQQYTHKKSVVWPGGVARRPADFVAAQCGAGEHVGVNVSVCVECGPGLFQDARHHSNTSCIRCSPGMYADASGMRKCLECKVCVAYGCIALKFTAAAKKTMFENGNDWKWQ